MKETVLVLSNFITKYVNDIGTNGRRDLTVAQADVSLVSLSLITLNRLSGQDYVENSAQLSPKSTSGL